MEAICIVDFEQQEKDREDTGARARFYEFYGVWFHGRLKEIVTLVARERFNIDLHKRMHVFIEPEGFEKDNPILSDGIHDVTVYGQSCRLYKWMAQGYHRGLVVLADDRQGNASAEIYYASKTWSWMLEESDKKLLPELLDQQQ